MCIRRLAMTALALGTLSLAACATVPEQIQGTYSDVSPARVEPTAFGSEVRWGGVIIDAINERASTCFEVLSRDLDRYLRPLEEDRSSGRFLACKPGFHDPEVFAHGREITLTGRIRDFQVRQVGDFSYRYPVVDVDELVLWEPRQEVTVIEPYYDPFWYPYWGWGYPYMGYYYYPYYRLPYPLYGRGHLHTYRPLPDPAETKPRR